jgi:hypothetical protein
MIVSIEDSPVHHKRFRVYIKERSDASKKDGKLKHYDFGLKTGRTYIDDRTEQERQNYLKRHLANPIERQLIDHLIPSPSLFSAYLLWGKSKDLNKNIEYLNRLFRTGDSTSS